MEKYELSSEEVSTSHRVETKKRKHVWLRLLLIVGLIFMVFLLCGGIIKIVADSLVRASQDFQEDWLVVGDAFMRAMAAEDIDQVYTFFDEKLRSEVSRSDLAAMIEGPLFALFDDYQSLEIAGWYYHTDFLKGTTSTISGIVSYEEQFSGTFEFVLTQEEGTWNILAFWVNAPPEKFNSYAAESR